MIVDLGCGPNKRPSADVGVDVRDYDGVDVVCDIEDGLPFDDGAVDRVLAYHVLEHVADLPAVMAEIHRVLVDGGTIRGKVPHYRDRDAYTDPTHKQYFSAASFDYWDAATEYGSMDYFDVGFRVRVAERVRRLRVWRSRPVRFELEAVKA